MPENDFEKEVQKKMDELQFVPSAAVWHEVEKQITPRRKRRILVWLPLLLLLLGGAALFYTIENKKPATAGKNVVEAVAAHEKNEMPAGSGTSATETAKQPSAKKENTTASKKAGNEQVVVATLSNAPNKNTAAAGHNATADNGVVASKASQVNQKNNRGNKPANKPGYENTPASNALLATGNNRHNKQLPLAIIPWKAPGQAEKEKIKTYKDIIAENAGAHETTVLPKEKNIPANSNVISPAIIIPDTAATVTVASQPPAVIASMPGALNKEQLADSVVAAAVNKIVNKKKSRIEWGIGVQAGSSNISQGVTSLFKSAPAYDVSSLSFSAPSNNTGGSNNGVPGSVAPPSDVSAGVGYALGAFISKPVARQLKIIAAINYSYYSTRIMVGAPISNSGLSTQYRTGTASRYTNSFHFIELPLRLQKQFGKASRFSVDGGLALAFLTGSRALLYDASQNQYVTGKTDINSFQTSILAGFSYRFFPKSLPVEIGPGFNYGLGNMFTKEKYGSTHLFFAGVKATIFLSKK